MRIALFTNGVNAPTGYGQQAAQLTKRLQADGHEVAVICNYGVVATPQVIDDIVHYPVGPSNPYSLDVADMHAAHWFGGERGLVITLYDTWPLRSQPDLFAEHDAWYWTPIDHAPPPPEVLQWCKSHDIIAMADYGAEQLTKAGVPPRYTIPHAIDRSVYKPTPSDIRSSTLDVPDDAHLTTIVMANIGNNPVRKSWFENLMAWRLFAERHHDAYLYIHTQLQHPRGIDLAKLIKVWGLPVERTVIVDQAAYISGMIGPDTLAKIYSASDVTLMATAGEGFGVPAIESAACGTPVIGTDFSAQQQTVCGWRVPYTTFFDYAQGAGQALPDIPHIAAALDESYEHRGEREQECLDFAEPYDADTVYSHYWQPFLADREAEREPKPNRQQRRAQKKAKA